MKKILYLTLLLLVSLSTFNCSNPFEPDSPTPGDTTPDDTNTGATIDSFFWGSWLGIGSDATWYISGTSILKNGSPITISSATSTDITIADGVLSKDSDSVLKYTLTGSTVPYFLYRNFGATNSFTASVVGISGNSNVMASRGLSSLGGIRAIITNTNNPEDTREVVTGADGSLNATETIVGDDYTITIPVQNGVEEVVTAEVTPLFDDQDLGIVNILADSANFKMNLTTTQSMYSRRADGVTAYPVTVEISSIGSLDFDEASYSITFPDGLIIASGVSAEILGTIFTGETKTIPLTVICPVISTVSEDKHITITLTNSMKTQTWTETLSLRFLKDFPQFSIEYYPLQNTVNGLVIDPDGIPTRISSASANKTSFYWKPGTWTVVFGGTGSGTETKYAVGVDSDSTFPSSSNNSAFSALTDSSTGEPNNATASASSLAVGSYALQYLGAKDVDFYTFTFPSYIGVAFDANGADSGSVPPAQTHSPGMYVSLPGNTGNLQKNGYMFAGWLNSTTS